MPFKIGDLVETCQRQPSWNPLIRSHVDIPPGTMGWIIRITEYKGGETVDVEEIGNHTPKRASLYIRFLDKPVSIYSPSAVRNITSKARKQEHATRKALETARARTFGSHRETKTQNREVAGSGD